MSFSKSLFIVVMLAILTNATRYEQSGRFEPSEIPADAKYLTFRNYELPILPANLFLKFTRCTRLKFDHMSFSEIEPGAWNGLQNLGTLDVQFSELTVLNAGIFAGLKLYHLKMANNKISVIEHGVWDDLPRLNMLNLQYNEITTLPAAAFKKLTSLTFLDLSFNNMREIEYGAWEDLQELAVLSLHHNEIIALPAAVFKNLTSLTELLLSNSKIELIEYGAWEDLELLETLHLNDNKIIVLKADIFQNLTSLRHLYLHSNYIIEIETEAFQFCDSLISLIVWKNTFSFKSSTLQSALQSHRKTLSHLTLNVDPTETFTRRVFENLTDLRELGLNGFNSAEPGAFKDLDSLEKLDLGYSALNEFNFKSLDSKVLPDVSDSLMHLVLHHNDITSLYADMFINLGILSMLDLSWNKIAVIEKGAFNGLKMLYYLRLDGNNIRIENAYIKDLNETLEVLHLSYNRITHIPEDYFEHFGMLQELYLGRNRITFLSPNTFKGLPMLSNLQLSYNDLKTLQRNIFASEDFIGTGGHPGILHSVT